MKIPNKYEDESDGSSGSPPPPPPPPADWVKGLAPELQTVVTAKKWKEPGEAIKSYTELEKLMGVNRLPEPRQDWTESQWAEFYKRVGRPDSPDKYNVPKVELPENFKLDDNLVKAAKEQLHKLGLTGKQFEGAMSYYLELIKKDYQTTQDAVTQRKSEGVTKLKGEWKDDFDANLNLAKAVLNKFGDEAAVKFINDTGLGDHPEFIKMFHKIGKAISEDTLGGARGAGLAMVDSVTAQNEINALKLDKDFNDAYLNHSNPAHKAAVIKMKELFKRAFPGKEPV